MKVPSSMLEISFLFSVFISSILLVSIILRSQISAPAAHDISILSNIKLLIKTAPFMAWVEHENQTKWGNSTAKHANKQTEATGNKEAHKSKKPQNQFIQTLSVTFAQLQVGIAVFNHKNELSLFNPALSQHLGLRPEWLLKKPNLLGFLDRLRDTNILPEPKNYTSWRKTFHKIERSAMKDDYREDWELPDGRALRVIGRPHPSGTVVFLFEDVTATLDMERNFRAKISTYKNTLNAATVGFVVFNRNGNKVYSNKVLKQTLGKQSEFTTIQDFSMAMQNIFHPTPVWGDFRQFVQDSSEKTRWQADVQTLSGDYVSMHFIPINSNSTLCEFHFPPKINTANNVSLPCAAQ